MAHSTVWHFICNKILQLEVSFAPAFYSVSSSIYSTTLQLGVPFAATFYSSLQSSIWSFISTITFNNVSFISNNHFHLEFWAQQFSIVNSFV